MKNAKAVVSALALTAAMALPAAAEELPLNTVTGGAGQEGVEGQALIAGGLAGSSIGLIAVVGLAVAVAASDNDDATATTE